MKPKHLLPLIAALTFEVCAGGNVAQLLPDGEFRSVDGSGRPVECAAWRIDAEIAAKLVAQVAATANRFVIDYEHATLKKALKGEEAPAAGWFKQIEYRPGKGVYMTDVEWTKRAGEMINAGEYRYISCVFSYDNDGRVTRILHAALTNTPALDGMDEVHVAALSRLVSLSSDQPNQEQNMDELLEQLRWLLNLPVGATADDVKAQLQKLIDQLSGGQGTAAASADIGALLSGKDTQIAALSAQVGTADPAKFVPISVMQDLQGQVAALTAQVNESKVADLVDVALADGRLLPTQEDWARGLGKTNLAALSAYLDTAPKIAALSSTQTGGNAPDASHTQPDDAFMAVCSMFGNDPSAVQQTLNKEQPQ